MFVTLIPGGVTGLGWRFVGEQQWRASGVVATGLTTGDRVIEFRPVPGYIQPPPETVSVISGGAPVVLTREYYESVGGAGTGGLTVTLKPDALAAGTVPVADRAQWRLLGEDDTQWRNSGAVLTGLLAGNYLVESKPVAGRTTPPTVNVPVRDGQTSAPTVTYFLADPQTGTPPAVLSFDTVSTSQNLPYAYVGQIRSDVGVSSGFVVKPRVVATAAHVVFDDGALSYAFGLQWLLQRDRGTYEPKPQIPRGFYVFDGYAARRTLENTPGTSSPQSQNLDAAALYFLEDAGRGGFGGYLASDAAQNEFLLSSSLKTLVGYPVDGIPLANQGRMHATPPANVTFASAFGRTYTTANIRSSGGGSGGPLCVQLEGGNYYPAAIYLGGSAQTVVRAIDSQVLDLFNRAEVSANGGGNNTGGGIVQVNTPIGSSYSPASVIVNILPPEATSAGAQWKLGSTATPNTSSTRLDSLSATTYNLVFTSVSGFIKPATSSLTLSGGALSTITATYNGILVQPRDKTKIAFESVSMGVTVSGTPSSYQWQKNGVNIAGANASSISFPDLRGADTGGYRCVVTWDNGSQTSDVGTLTVIPAIQTITFAKPADRLLRDGAFNLSATSSSARTVTFAILSGAATLGTNGVTLTPIGSGTVTVRASLAANANYSAAPDVDGSFLVSLETLNSWRGDHFTAAELTNPLISGPLADFDGDGANTLLEFALNLDPKVGDRVTMTAATGTRGLPLITRESAAPFRATAEFVRRKVSALPGITYRIEFSSDLTNAANWTASGTEVVTPIDATWERVKVTDSSSNPTTRFGRLVITQP